MKKTRFEKFMTSTTKTAMALVELDTFEDHLEYTKLMIDVELLKIGKKGGKKKITKKAVAGKAARISGVLGSIKRGLIWSWNGIREALGFASTGNNAAILIMGAIILYAVIVMILEAF